MKDDLKWTALLSTTYANFVDEGLITYKDLWVQDASRMMQMFERLYKKFNVIIAVEKDSLFGDFVDPARAMGIPSLLSGKGKNSKAAMELLLRNHFGWESFDENNFSREHPLVIVHLSDYDYDGEEVIGNTFGNQARRYTDHILEARVGIQPIQVQSNHGGLQDTMYKVKVRKNKKVIQWAEEMGIHYKTCSDCGNVYIGQGIGGTSDCCQAGFDDIDVLKEGAHGFEVEALMTRDYYSLLVAAVLSVLPFDTIVENLRYEIEADPEKATEDYANKIAEQNSDYIKLMKLQVQIDKKKRSLRDQIYWDVLDHATDHAGDFWDHGADPSEYELYEHVEGAQSDTEKWEPFSVEERTALLVNDMVKDIDSVEYKSRNLGDLDLTVLD